MRQKALVPVSLRKVPALLCCTLTICRSPWAKKCQELGTAAMGRTGAQSLLDHQCVVAQSYNWFGPKKPPPPPALELVEADCHNLVGTGGQCCLTQVIRAVC